MLGFPYTARELRFLKENYSERGGAFCVKRLKKRTLQSIRQKAHGLGLTQKRAIPDLYPKSRKEKMRNTKLRKAYGLSLEDFDALSKNQRHLCKICGLPESEKKFDCVLPLSVDHNHNTGKIRGLLCSRCNKALGLLNVDNLGVMNLHKAIEYLK